MGKQYAFIIVSKTVFIIDVNYIVFFSFCVTCIIYFSLIEQLTFAISISVIYIFYFHLCNFHFLFPTV